MIRSEEEWLHRNELAQNLTTRGDDDRNGGDDDDDDDEDKFDGWDLLLVVAGDSSPSDKLPAVLSASATEIDVAEGSSVWRRAALESQWIRARVRGNTHRTPPFPAHACSWR